MPNPSDIAIMLNDDELVRLVASWPKIKDRSNLDHVAIVANIVRRSVPDVVERALAHGLVYEDGTVNEYAQKYVSGLVAAELKRLNGNSNRRA